MAVEALNQVAEDQEIMVPSQGYTIQGLKIASALIIPSEGTVETLFNMRELSSSTKESSKWFDFRVSSVTEDGKWSEHAAGMVGLVSPENDVKKTRTRAARTKTTNGSKWYAALSVVGVEFGPTFQTLSDISLVPEKHEAIANIALRTTEHTMAAESRYVIHPTTLDGCLQLSVMAAHGNTKTTSKAFLPVFIEELTVWTPTASASSLEKAMIYAQGQIHGLRSVHGTAEVVDDAGQLLVQGKVSFLSLEGSLTNSTAENPRQPYSRLVWEPDVEKLGVILGQPASSSGLNNFQLTDFMDLVAHKGRPLKILQVGLDPTDTTVKALYGDSSQPLYSQYTLTSHDGVFLDEAKKKFHRYKSMDILILDIERDPSEQGFNTNTYDLIIISEVGLTFTLPW